jgi:hypothetical protein
MGDYNTALNKSVRIGNWNEENILEKVTGTRYYPDPKDRSLSLMTYSRCIVHTDRLEPKDYSTTQRDSIIDPKNHANYLPDTAKVGPREQLLIARLKREVDAEVDLRAANELKEARTIDYSSTK